MCLTDPTDWLGGQLTASAVSAIDFGANKDGHYWSKSWRALMMALGAPRNPGSCWVSTMCYEPEELLRTFIRPVFQTPGSTPHYQRTRTCSGISQPLTHTCASIS